MAYCVFNNFDQGLKQGKCVQRMKRLKVGTFARVWLFNKKLNCTSLKFIWTFLEKSVTSGQHICKGKRGGEDNQSAFYCFMKLTDKNTERETLLKMTFYCLYKGLFYNLESILSRVWSTQDLFWSALLSRSKDMKRDVLGSFYSNNPLHYSIC